MKLILHHFLKSVSVSRWILGLWLLIVAIQLGVSILSVQPDYSVAGPAEMIGVWSLWYLINTLGWTVVIVYVIQLEPIAGPNSFWRTRPVPPLVSGLSNLFFIVSLVIIPGLLPKTLDLLLFGVPFPAIHDALWASIYLSLFLALCVVWLATYTRSLGQFWGVIGIIFLFFISFSLFTASISSSSTPFFLSLPPKLLVSRFELATVLFLGGLIASLIVQHVLRTTGKASLLGLAGVLLAIAVLRWWPFVLPSIGFAKVDASAGKVIHLEYRLDPTKPFVWSTSHIGNSSSQLANLPLLSPPPPPAGLFRIRSITSSFQSKTTGNVTLPSPSAMYGIFAIDRLNWSSQLQQANPGFSIQGLIPPANIPTPAFELSPDLSDKLKDQTGSLSVTINGEIVTLQKRAEIPLRDSGLARIPSALVRLLAIQNDKAGFQLSLEEVGYRDLITSQSLPVVYLVVDRRNRRAFVPEQTGASSQSNAFGGHLVRMSQHLTLRVDAPGEPVNELLLYVYDITPGASFESEINVPNYTFHPGER